MRLTPKNLEVLILFLVTAGDFLGIILFLVTGYTYHFIFALFAFFFFAALTYAHHKDWKYAKYIFLILLVVSIPLNVEEPFLRQSISFAILIPPIIGITLSGAISGGIAGILVHLLILGKAGWTGAYTDPLSILIYYLIILLMVGIRKAMDNSNEELEKKYQFEKEMSGILSHELNGSMTLAKNTAELLLKKIENNDCDKKYIVQKINKIHHSLLKQTQLIQSMLSSNHADNNNFDIRLSNVNLEEVVMYAISLYEADANNKSLKLIYKRPDFEIPLIKSDPVRVQEIINNITSNAIKYTKEGYVRISFRLYKNNSIAVTIKDTGIGISEAHLKNLGKKFYRPHLYSSEKSIANGTGLGLYVVMSLIEALNGKLKIKSEVGKGSSFSVIFPIN